MSTVYNQGMERLQAVLDAPPTGKSRHEQVVDLARRHVREHPVHTKAVAADVTADVLGEFEAVVSDFLPDRQGERFGGNAFDGALDRIRKAGTSIPVLFGHRQDAVDSVLGMVPSTGWNVTNDSLVAKGWIDTSDSVGAKVFKMLKNGSLLWSIGFRIVNGNKSRRGSDGTVVIDHVDELLELSVVPVPANSRTRTVGMKADRIIPTHAELRARETALGLDGAFARLEQDRNMIVPRSPTLDELREREAAALRGLPWIARLREQRAPHLGGALDRLREQTRAEMERVLGDGKAHTAPRDDLRRRATQATQEYDLERVTSFDTRA